MLSLDDLRRLWEEHGAALAPRERLIMRKRLDDRQTFQQISRVLGLSRERIRQIEAEAVVKLRRAGQVQQCPNS